MTYDKGQVLINILQEIKVSTPAIDGLIILSWEGLTIASNFRSSTEEDITAAICATLISLAENSSEAFKRGIFEFVFVRSQEKSILLGKITEEVVLAIITKANNKLGVLIWELEKAKSNIEKVLG